ncbi:MAG: hypothetical protein ACOCTJ_00720 [Desulfobia sp.]
MGISGHKHQTTTAKILHSFFSTRLAPPVITTATSLNSALFYTKLEGLDFFPWPANRNWSVSTAIFFFRPPHIGYIQKAVGSRSNYWCNTILLPDSSPPFLEKSNQTGMEFA